jgi:hypothetical protein
LKIRGFALFIFIGSLLVGCGVARNPVTGNASSTAGNASAQSRAIKTLAQAPLIRRLSITLKNGRLTADMQRMHGSPLVSKPISLNVALHDPTTHYGVLEGPGWTLVFGAKRQGFATQTLVNGHQAIQSSTPPTVKPGYILWEYFLPGHVSRPVVKLVNHS